MGISPADSAASRPPNVARRFNAWKEGTLYQVRRVATIEGTQRRSATHANRLDLAVSLGL